MHVRLPSGGWWDIETRPRWRHLREWMRSRREPGAQEELADEVLVSLTNAWSFDLPVETASLERIDPGDLAAAFGAVRQALAELWDTKAQRERTERLFTEMAAGRVPDEFEEARVMALTGWSWHTLQETPADAVEAMMAYLSVRSVRENGGALDFPAPANAG